VQRVLTRQGGIALSGGSERGFESTLQLPHQFPGQHGHQDMAVGASLFTHEQRPDFQQRGLHQAKVTFDFLQITIACIDRLGVQVILGHISLQHITTI
jgi:hypothetical protein